MSQGGVPANPTKESKDATVNACDSDKKRKPQLRWNEEREILLLRQVAGDLPFTADHGKSEDMWGHVVEKLAILPQFTAGLEWKKARSKFNGENL